MRPVNSLKNALFNSLYRSSLISTVFAILIVITLIFLSIEKDLRAEGEYLGKLVFKELRQAMNRGASYEEVNQLITELNENAPDISYAMFRGEAVQKQFGEGRNLTDEIIQHLDGNSDATHVETLDKIHYFRAIPFKQECLQCHLDVKVGDIAGVLDVTFPAERVSIPIYEVLLGMFLLFSITIISSYIALSSDLLSHMIEPLQRLERKLKETEGHHDLNERLKLNTGLKELTSIEHSFNAQQELLHQAYRKVEEVSIYDKLTGTYNRHQLERLFLEETTRATRQNKPLTVAMIDLNGFKQINDSYGHQAGDEILKNFCNVLIENLRVTDKVIRFGGDEFLILLPDSERSQAQVLFKRVQKTFDKEQYFFKGKPLKTQFSVGTAEYPSEAPPDQAIELIELADARMYQEKQLKKMTRLDSEHKKSPT